MAPRFGFSLATLRKIDPAACAADARLVWKDADAFNVGVVTSTGFIQGLYMSSSRELRLLGAQMIRHADNRDREEDHCEVVIP